jgi:hypothetical protein
VTTPSYVYVVLCFLSQCIRYFLAVNEPVMKIYRALRYV